VEQGLDLMCTQVVAEPLKIDSAALSKPVPYSAGPGVGLRERSIPSPTNHSLYDFCCASRIRARLFFSIVDQVVQRLHVVYMCVDVGGS